MCTSQAELDSQSWYDYKSEQEEERGDAMAIETSKQAEIKVGDPVRLKSTEEYVGKVAEVRNVKLITITLPSGSEVVTLSDGLEVAPRLTEAEAWAELPYTVLGQINQRMAWGALRLLDYDQKQIRSACYRLLGSAGIKIEKVDGPIKQRVRKAIERIADAMGVELA